MRVLFLGKRDDAHCDRALDECRRRFHTVEAYLGDFGQPLPKPAESWAGDVILSYLSRWIVPPGLLARARHALNFHPAPPEYPGVGCINFALYEGAESYGVTCHHMAPVVDSGAIIAVRRFPVHPDDDVEALLSRAYDHQLSLFCEIVQLIALDQPLPADATRWGPHTYTRGELNALAEIRCDMSADEIRRRVRATTFRSWSPELLVHGFRFRYEPTRR